MAECARPLQYAASIVHYTISYLGMELSLAWGMPVLGISGSECSVSPPTEPHTVLLSSTKMVSWAMKNGGFAISKALSHEEIARLQDEPEWRNRWTELWVSLEPLLKEIEDIIWTKAHLAEPVKLNSVTAIVPYPELGCSWEDAFMSPGVLYQTVAVWTRQWCAPLHCPMLPRAMPHAPASHTHRAARAQGVCARTMGSRRVRPAAAHGARFGVPTRGPGHGPGGELRRARDAAAGPRPTDFSLYSVQCVQPQLGARKAEPPVCVPCVALKT